MRYLSNFVLVFFTLILFASCNNKSSSEPNVQEKEQVKATTVELNLSSFAGMVDVFASSELTEEYEVVARVTSGVEQIVNCGSVNVAQMLEHVPSSAKVADLALEITTDQALMRFTRHQLSSKAWNPVMSIDREDDWNAGKVVIYMGSKKAEGYWSSNSLKGVPLIIQTELEGEPITLEFRIQKKGSPSAFCGVG
jgi:hypothetical protein